jgi:hypothetical protein
VNEEIVMDDSKPWWQSNGVWGGIVAVVAVILGFFGYEIGGELQGELVEAITGAVAIVGALWGIIGRVRASKRIGQP